MHVGSVLRCHHDDDGGDDDHYDGGGDVVAAFPLGHVEESP